MFLTEGPGHVKICVWNLLSASTATTETTDPPTMTLSVTALVPTLTPAATTVPASLRVTGVMVLLASTAATLPRNT